MRKHAGKLGYWAAGLLAVSFFLFAAANLISRFASCQYDDLWNVWSCSHAWAAHIMGYFDVLIFFLAYPALGAGVLLTLVRLIRGK